MRRYELAALDQAAAAFDRAVTVTDDVDRFCSSSAWVISAAEALMAPGEPRIVSSEGCFAAFSLRPGERGPVLEPLELTWGLACPLVGGDPKHLADLASAVLAPAGWELAVIAGMVPGSPLFRAVVGRFAGRRIGLGPPTRRHIASLTGGVDGFLSRRPRELRKALRRSSARAAALGLVAEHHRPTTGPELDALFARVLTIEARSWKGRDATGLADPAMAGFYRAMLRRLAPRGDARASFLRIGERDVAFVLGARFLDGYRGLQFGFDDDHRALGLGNLAQLRVVEALAAESVATYDLGTGGDYKSRWAETVVDTAALVISAR